MRLWSVGLRWLYSVSIHCTAKIIIPAHYRWRAVGVSPKAEKVETDGDFDLFGSEEDEEKAEVTAARLKVCCHLLKTLA